MCLVGVIGLYYSWTKVHKCMTFKFTYFLTYLKVLVNQRNKRMIKLITSVLGHYRNVMIYYFMTLQRSLCHLPFTGQNFHNRPSFQKAIHQSANESAKHHHCYWKLIAPVSKTDAGTRVKTRPKMSLLLVLRSKVRSCIF